MIRWESSDPGRFHAQEQALLSLCDRMALLEQAFATAIDRASAARFRLDRLEIELKRLQARLTKLERELSVRPRRREADR
ncbi:MAG: hypothetical protein ACK4TJ_00150 [Tabrizicola sp.]